MKGIYLYLCFLSPIFLHAQIFSSTSNHSNNGVLNMLSNPANLRTDSLFTWDANFFSIGAWGGGTHASMSVKQLTGVSNNFLRESILGISGLSTGSGIADITGPSIAFKVGKKSSFAIGTRVRMFSNFWNVDGRLVSEIGEDKKEPQAYPYMVSSSKDMMLNAAMFSDISLSYAKEVYEKGPHSIKAGITLKYITAMSHASIDVQGLQGKVAVTSDGVPYITAATGQITTRSSGNLFTDIKLGSLTSALIGNGSIGADIGLVYEYKPADLKNSKTDYRFKVGVSITDIGKIAYHPDSLYSRSYNVHIPASNALYFNNNFQNSSFAHTTEVYDKYPDFFTPTATQSSKYKVGLPTTLRAYIDANLGNGLFVSADINAGLQKKESVTAMYVYNAIALIPRYEKGDFSISLPMVYQGYTHASVGLGINAGPFYIGSSSLISGLVSKTKQLDGFVGLRIDPDKKKKQLKTPGFNAFLITEKEDKKSMAQKPTIKEQAKFTTLTHLIEGDLLTESILTTANTVPFWMRSNQYGSIPLDGASLSVIASATKKYDPLRNANLLDWGAGFDMRLNGGKSAQAILVEAYAKARIGIFEIKAGRSKQVVGLVDSSGLSSGAFSMSGNALGIPKLQLAVNEYHTLPFWNKFISLKGSIEYGWLGTTLLRTDTININGPFGRRPGYNTPETYFIQQELYAKFGKPNAKLNFFAGINHNVMYGDEQKIYNDFNLSKWTTFMYAFKGKTWESFRTKIGNQMGSVDLGLSYKFNYLNLFVYRQSFYDVGALGKLANIADGLNGISIENKKRNTGTFYWKKILVELFYSKNQAGDSNAIVTSSGAENYYNNYLYVNGWSYKGLGIGNPFITTKTVARKGLPSLEDLFLNNRVVALHIGASVRIKTVDLIGKFSWSNNYGTYNTSPDNPRSVGPPYFGELSQFSGYLEANKQLKNGYKIGGVFALDAGKLLYNSTGFMLKVSKSFNK